MFLGHRISCVRKKFWVRLNLESEKTLGMEINFGPKILSENFWVRKIFDPKKNLSKTYLVEKIWVQKFLVKKKF